MRTVTDKLQHVLSIQHVLLQSGYPSCRPTNSVKALKAHSSTNSSILIVLFISRMVMVVVVASVVVVVVALVVTVVVGGRKHLYCQYMVCTVA